MLKQLRFVKDGKVEVAEFEGRKIVLKTKRGSHPNLVAHVKALKLIWNEFVKIWGERRKERKAQLYSTRFFDLAMVEEYNAIYEQVSGTTYNNLLVRKDISYWKKRKIVKGYSQLKTDFFKAYEKFSKNEGGVVRVKEYSFNVYRDFWPENVLFEGFDEQGRPKFILMDVIYEW